MTGTIPIGARQKITHYIAKNFLDRCYIRWRLIRNDNTRPQHALAVLSCHILTTLPQKQFPPCPQQLPAHEKIVYRNTIFVFGT